MKNEALLAKDIIAASRKRIMQLCPTLTQSIHLLEPVVHRGNMHTDGSHFFYEPKDIVSRFREDNDSVAYALLHLTLHCLLGHIGARSVEDLELFDAIADHEVHAMTEALCPSLSMKYRPKVLPMDHHPLSQCHHFIKDNKKYRGSYLREQERNHVDLHAFWNLKFKLLPSMTEEGKRLAKQLGLAENKDLFHFGRHSRGWEQSLLMAAEKSDRDYKTLLERFLQKQLKEAPSTQDIDPMWYHFGLDYLGDIPIIEPAEEEDLPSNGTLAIALDTSGSCNGEVCRRFLREIHTMLQSLSEKAAFDEIILLQCDAEIQEEKRIAKGEQWESILASFLPKGFGGTDFCPVFQRLSQEKDINCLVYFTDGYGEYPDSPPSYPTLFLLDDDHSPHFMPEWIEVIPYHAS